MNVQNLKELEAKGLVKFYPDNKGVKVVKKKFSVETGEELQEEESYISKIQQIELKMNLEAQLADVNALLQFIDEVQAK